MKIFIWDYLPEVSNRYHSGGGLVVVAESLEHAQELVAPTEEVNSEDDDEYDKPVAIKLSKPPTKVYTLTGEDITQQYWVFKDAGCC